eukprot:26189_5
MPSSNKYTSACYSCWFHTFQNCWSRVCCARSRFENQYATVNRFAIFNTAFSVVIGYFQRIFYFSILVGQGHFSARKLEEHRLV